MSDRYDRFHGGIVDYKKNKKSDSLTQPELNVRGRRRCAALRTLQPNGRQKAQFNLIISEMTLPMPCACLGIGVFALQTTFELHFTVRPQCFASPPPKELATPAQTLVTVL